MIKSGDEKSFMLQVRALSVDFEDPDILASEIVYLMGYYIREGGPLHPAMNEALHRLSTSKPWEREQMLNSVEDAFLEERHDVGFCGSVREQVYPHHKNPHM